MAANKRRQDERHLKILRELGSQPSNKQCFDCHQRGPTYINMTIGSFVCTSCSGILRGLNPPHRVKSISMTSFTPDEIEFIKTKGNEYCRRVWLGTYDSRSFTENESKDEQRIKDFLIQKYEKKRWYVDPSMAMRNQSISIPNSVTPPTTLPETKPLTSILGNQVKPLFIQTNQNSNCNKSTVTSNIVTNTNQQPPRPSLDLLSEFVADPFASTGTNHPANHSNANFANFDNFNSAKEQNFETECENSLPPSSSNFFGAAPLSSHESDLAKGMTSPPSVGSTPMSIVSSGSQFSGFAAISSPVSAAVTNPSNATTLTPPAPPSQDKYAALADLDNLFNNSNNVNSSVEWEGASKSNSFAWPMNGSSPTAFGSTPTSTGTTAVMSGSSNPFSSTTQQPWAPLPQQSASFATGNPFATSGFGVQPLPSSNSFGQFGSSPVNSQSAYLGYPSGNGQINQLSSIPNGGIPPVNNSNWATNASIGGWVNFNSTSQSLFPSSSNAFQNTKMSPFGAWQPNVGNPFVGGNTSLTPRGGSSNPFL